MDKSNASNTEHAVCISNQGVLRGLFVNVASFEIFIYVEAFYFVIIRLIGNFLGDR